MAVSSVGRVPPEAPLPDFSKVLSFKNMQGEGYVSQRTTYLPLIKKNGARVTRNERFVLEMTKKKVPDHVYVLG
jgi:N-dimethylarginine dimethylaminohydrolase